MDTHPWYNRFMALLTRPLTPPYLPHVQHLQPSAAGAGVSGLRRSARYDTTAPAILPQPSTDDERLQSAGWRRTTEPKTAAERRPPPTHSSGQRAAR